MNEVKEIRLDKNELPYSPPDFIQNALKDSIKHLNRYTPQELVDELTLLLSEYTSVPKSNIILRPGSDILIKELMFLFAQNRQLIISDPTFIVIGNAAQKVPSSVLKVKLSAPEFKFPANAIQEDLTNPTLIFLDIPNNPTGKLVLTSQEIESLLTNKNVILIIDEAYFEFSNFTVAPLIKKYENLGVLRTLSKSFGLAGAGSGYLIAGEILRKKLAGLEIMLPYSCVLGSIVALKHKSYFLHLIKDIQAEKIRMERELEHLGITIYSSATNFLLLKTDMPLIAQELMEHGIFIYDASNYFSPGYIRVSIGKQEENNRFLEVLEKILEK